jgi:acetyl-CoA C-acetyltransferase
MKDVYLVEGLRTPLGGFQGSLSSVEATDLGAQTIQCLIKKTNIPASAINEVIMGNVLSAGFGQAPARQAMIKAGLDNGCHALTINKVCGSGMKAIHMAADAIKLGNADVIIAGGMENMSNTVYTLPKARAGYRMGNAQVMDLMVHDGLTDPYSGNHMGVLAEKTAEKNNISRQDQDDWATRSYNLSQKAVSDGKFKDEIASIKITTRKGEIIVDSDEEPFRGDVSKLAGLRSAFIKDGTITAGNASTISDGAAVILLASQEAVDKYNLKPIAKLKAGTSSSIAPDDFSEGPVYAMQKILEQTNLKATDIDLYEINEAFAVVPIVAQRKLNIDIDKINVNGGAISLGHPIGASGARIVVTLMHEMKKQQAKYGLASLCIGGGEGIASILELV